MSSYVIIPTDELIFCRGVGIPPTSISSYVIIIDYISLGFNMVNHLPIEMHPLTWLRMCHWNHWCSLLVISRWTSSVSNAHCCIDLCRHTMGDQKWGIHETEGIQKNYEYRIHIEYIWINGRCRTGNPNPDHTQTSFPQQITETHGYYRDLTQTWWFLFLIQHQSSSYLSDSYPSYW